MAATASDMSRFQGRGDAPNDKFLIDDGNMYEHRSKESEDNGQDQDDNTRHTMKPLESINPYQKLKVLAPPNVMLAMKVSVKACRHHYASTEKLQPEQDERNLVGVESIETYREQS